MEPKPLSWEERFRVLNAKAQNIIEMKWAIDRALAAEAYWREVVKTFDPMGGILLHQDLYCQICDQDRVQPKDRYNHRDPICHHGHKPGCAWQKAQE